MSNEEKKNLENEEVNTDISLITQCQRTDNLPVIQKLALKQKVSFRFEFTKHSYMRNEGNPSAKFATYITLLETKPELYGNVCDILTDNFVSEEVVEECLLYIRSGIVPYHLWTDKLVHDLSESFYYNSASIGGMLAVYLGKTLKASLIAFNKVIKVLTEDIDKWNDDVKEAIAFVSARALEYPQDLKEKYMTAFGTDDELTRVKFQENETTIFTETLIDMLQYPFDQKVIERMAEGTATPFEDFWVTPMFGGGSTLVSYARGAGNTMQQSMGEADEEEKKGGMGSWLQMLGYGPNGETPEEMARARELRERQEALVKQELEEKTNKLNRFFDEEIENSKPQPTRTITNQKPQQYCVKKVARDGSKRVMSENWFDTEKQAQDFVKEVTESNPAMAKAFKFDIEPGYRP